jgi:hypothetical protein
MGPAIPTARTGNVPIAPHMNFVTQPGPQVPNYTACDKICNRKRSQSGRKVVKLCRVNILRLSLWIYRWHADRSATRDPG